MFVAPAQGEQVTWAKLSAIEANCGIETTLDACMLRLSEVSAAKRRVRTPYSSSASPSHIVHALHQQVLRSTP